MTWRSWPPTLAGSVDSFTDATDRTDTCASCVPPPVLKVMYVPLVGMGKVWGGVASSATDSSTAYQEGKEGGGVGATSGGADGA